MARPVRTRPAEDDELDDAAPDWRAPAGASVLTLPEPEPAPEPVPETPADRIARLLSETANDATAVVRLYRVQAGTNKLTWCQNYSPSEFEAGDLEMIRSQWGPGEYEIRLYVGGRIRAKEVVTIAHGLGAQANPAPAARQENNELASIMRLLAEGQQRILDALSQRPDPTAQLSQTLGLMVQMREAMGLNQVAPAPQKSSIAEIVEAVRELRKVSEEINPRVETEEESLMSLAGKVIAMVQAHATSAQGASPIVPAVTVPPSVDRVSSPSTIQGASNPSESPAMTDKNASAAAPDAEQARAIEMLRAQLRQLCAMAASGVSHEVGAERIYAEIPDEALPLLELPNWFDLLAQFEPATAAHRAWFEKAHALVIEWLAEDEHAPQDDASGAGDSAALSTNPG
jgi:hypothetical protein